MFDVSIVGAGAAGLFAARYLSLKSDLSVLLLEGGHSCGRKLGLTGNGKCNIGNKDMESSFYHCEDDSFLQFLRDSAGKDSSRYIELLDEMGIPVSSQNGLLYPLSRSASSVVSRLLENRTKLRTESKVREIVRNKDSFLLYGDKENGKRPLLSDSRYVILAAGGASYPKTGSDGSGYKLLKKLGIDIEEPKPSLVPLVVKDFDPVLKGARARADLKLYLNDSLAAHSKGEVQFTSDGLSGICVFELSGTVVRAGEDKKVIVLDLLPELSLYDLEEEIRHLGGESSSDREELKKRLITLLPERLLDHVLNNFFKSGERSLNKLAFLIKNDSYLISESKGFEQAQTTTGGARIYEIEKTMEAKKVPGLFITGELLDMDGICGGYNLTQAFLTSKLACDEIIRRSGER